MENQVYSDDVGAIGVSGPIVRVDLLVQPSAEQVSGNKPKLVVEHQLVMPIDAFLRAAVRIQGVVQDMEKQGIITRKPKPTEDGPSS